MSSISTNSQGVLVYNNQGEVSSTTTATTTAGHHHQQQHPGETGLFLQVTHFTPLSPDIVWSNNPSITVSFWGFKKKIFNRFILHLKKIYLY
ncbi:unnamed protein product [Trichobilharzia regenti]|nr:unnamed protein product [Trichobilharzia regenti]